MADWSSDLNQALASGNPEYMKAMLAQVPSHVLHMAIPYLERLAHSTEKSGSLALALTYYEQLLEAAPGRIDWQADRVRVLLALDRSALALAAAERIAAMAPESALGYCLQADVHAAAGRLPLALAALHEARGCAPDDTVIRERVYQLEAALRKEAAVRLALDPGAEHAALHLELPPPPAVTFDPALLDDPSIPPSFDTFRVEGLRQHLRRHSGQVSARHSIDRLEDPVWLAAWDAALSDMAGKQVMLRGSELGVFALRALHHGAAHALCVEDFPLDTRITTGMVQKRYLTSWHAQHGAAIPGWSEEQRRASFEAFAGAIDIVMADDRTPVDAHCDCFVFPHLDHTLLGTGIVRAVRQYCAQEGSAPARVVPARATVFAMGIEWAYPGAALPMAPVNRLRWSMQPQALELGPQFWHARTAPVRCGEIDFANFAQATWELALPATGDGAIDAIVYWFELDLGNARLSNAPASDLQCIKPALQYTDAIAVRSGDMLQVRARVEENRLWFQALPAASLERSASLPQWHVPRLGDRAANAAYNAAIGAALAASPAALVLNIGCSGALAVAAAHAGAGQVIGCETHPGVLQAGREIVVQAGLAERITILGKDCRKLTLAGDLPRRADLALFDLFDCSLIGDGILHFLAHARTNLLAANARYLPAGARIRAMLIEYRLEQVWDIDASLLNAYRCSPTATSVDAATLPYRALSAPFDVFDFDFATAGPAPQELALEPLATASGMAGAVLFWFELRLDQHRVLSNDPRSDNTLHWKQGLKVLPEVRVGAGDVLPLLARHDGSGLDFGWQLDRLAQDAVSKAPRCDPRWLAASGELEQQTRSLMQHCSQSPDEYVKVADIAKRFAVDPGTHGLDPAIAQRFAAMFIGQGAG